MIMSARERMVSAPRGRLRRSEVSPILFRRSQPPGPYDSHSLQPRDDNHFSAKVTQGLRIRRCIHRIFRINKLPSQAPLHPRIHKAHASARFPAVRVSGMGSSYSRSTVRA